MVIGQVKMSLIDLKCKQKNTNYLNFAQPGCTNLFNFKFLFLQFKDKFNSQIVLLDQINHEKVVVLRSNAQTQGWGCRELYHRWVVRPLSYTGPLHRWYITGKGVFYSAATDREALLLFLAFVCWWWWRRRLVWPSSTMATICCWCSLRVARDRSVWPDVGIKSGQNL